MTIPQPPSDAELRLYDDQNKEWYYTLCVLSLIILTTGSFLFSLTVPGLFWYLPYGVLVLFYLGSSYLIGLSSKKMPLPQVDWGHEKPGVDVFVPTCGENIDVIRNTLAHARAMARTYGNARVHVLDDVKSAELEGLAKFLDCSYMTRDSNELRKAGNLRHAFAKTSRQFILILDADFAPRHDMLDNMIKYMYGDVAIVQSPQFFRVTGNWIEKGASSIQELFYRLIQPNRDYYGAPICVGSCALYRRKALEPFGGTAAIGYSEDVHTGFYVMTDGWKVRYTPENMAAGTCPETIKSFFSQQYRWCMGSITLLMNPLFWNSSKIMLSHRMCFLSGMLYYVTTALGIVFIPVPSLVVLWFYPELAHWWNVFFSLPSLAVGTIGIWAWTKQPWGLYVLKVRAISYWAHLFAGVDKARGNLMPWVPTGAVKANSRFSIFRLCFMAYTVLLTGLLLFGANNNGWAVDILPMVAVGCFYRILDLQICVELSKE